MFSQSLLPAAWRDCAAPPDSSASSQEATTPGLRPVSAESAAANCCWPEVSSELADAGSELPPSGLTPPVSGGWTSVPAPRALPAIGVNSELVSLEPASAVLVPLVSCAAASSLAKSVADPEPVDELVLSPLIPSCESSSEPLCSC